jgi:ATP-dependent Zn protease
MADALMEKETMSKEEVLDLFKTKQVKGFL